MTMNIYEKALRPNVAKKMRYLAIGLIVIAAIITFELAEGASFVQ